MADQVPLENVSERKTKWTHAIRTTATKLTDCLKITSSGRNLRDNA
jgi:hypothetical protein